MNEFLTLKHYKEPLKEVKGGFGFYGAIQVTLDGSKIQCHECGELFGNVGLHAWHRHDLTATAYKEKYQLSPSTALISEQDRLERKERALRQFMSMTKKEREAWSKKGRKLSMRSHRKESLELKNKKGTCPDQLLGHINEAADAIGHVPSKKEFIEFWGSQRYVHLIYKTFGSYRKAVEQAKLIPRGTPYYSDEELLEKLRSFKEMNGIIPTGTDCKRNLLPSRKTYQRRFGGLAKARSLAGII